MSSPLDEMIAALSRLSSLNVEAAKLAAPIVEEVAKRNADAGRTPDGEAWEPLKKGGGRPLEHASWAISVTAIGKVVRMKLEGVEVLHNFGTHRIPAREIIPSRKGDIPAIYAQAIQQAAGEAFDKLAGGR